MLSGGRPRGNLLEDSGGGSAPLIRPRDSGNLAAPGLFMSRARAGGEQLPRPGATPTYGFVIDNRRCIGCHACTVACKAEHEDPIGVNKTWVSYIEKGVYPDVSRAFHVMRCNHCADAPCVEICPTASLETRPDGIVDFDPGRCIGCKACMQACPYDAITIHPQSGTATKCNYCAHRVDVGREPACVVVCPTEAIVIGDLQDPSSKIARIVSGQDVSVRKPEKGTRPKLYYVDGDAAALNPSGAALSQRTLWGMKPPELAEIRNVAAPVQASERGAPRRTYDINQRHAASWGWKVSAYLFTKSIAAGVFLVPALLVMFPVLGAGEDSLDAMFRIATPLALVALAVTGVLLMADLKRPERFLWVLLRPQWRSWLVRGAYIISGYGAFLLACWLFPALLAEGARTAASVIGVLLAVGTACYSGWLFGQAKGRDLWQSPLVPVHLFVQALVTGVAGFLVLSPFANVTGLEVVLLVTLLANGLLIVVEIWGRHATADAEAAAHLMRTGPRGMRLTGVLFGGHIVPLIGLVVGGSSMQVMAGVLALAGVLLYEQLWVDAPQRLPLA